MVLVASQDLRVGEEITYDYKFHSYDSVAEQVIFYIPEIPQLIKDRLSHQPSRWLQPCYCDNKNCRGTIGKSN